MAEGSWRDTSHWWRALHESVGRSTRLRTVSHHDALLYTWGLAQTSVWGLVRRDSLKALAFPYRSTEGKVQAAIDRLLECGKLCQHQRNGHQYLHWCDFDTFQPETVRKRGGSPPFAFACPNEPRALERNEAEPGGTPRLARAADERKGKERKGSDTTPPKSPLLAAVVARWPTAGALFYQKFTDLEDEYGADFMWACYQEALGSNPEPKANYLESIARRCKAEGKMPGDREDLKDEQPERPTEIDGKPVVGWNGTFPIYAS